MDIQLQSTNQNRGKHTTFHLLGSDVYPDHYAIKQKGNHIQLVIYITTKPNPGSICKS